ncbi:hypothetical protein NEOLI_003164 [Neolecta irregularis DAH-3]|uniref:Uncharacterized protein n=1 Tax=Neolecta irregularis (strain DAH-3) TaxID=1198029 RepID=A0A1U7LQ35_NEOID|nr:hypothetical protein NEOLI_003164 [Neolecta irregularis DAH-3]|eukprot:OLL24631.1 hypothetical protein NEOLI_003164 [Neolecta irregularis DAH-3]
MNYHYDRLWNSFADGQVASEPYFSHSLTAGDDLNSRELNMNTPADTEYVYQSVESPDISYPSEISLMKERYRTIFRSLHNRNAILLQSLLQSSEASNMPSRRINLTERLQESDRQFGYLWTVIHDILNELSAPHNEIEVFQQRECEFLRYAEELRIVNDSLERDCSVLNETMEVGDDGQVSKIFTRVSIPDPARDFRENGDEDQDYWCGNGNDHILEDFENHPWHRNGDPTIGLDLVVQNIMQGGRLGEG